MDTGPLSPEGPIEAGRHLTAHHQGVVLDKALLLQLMYVQEGDIAEALGIALERGPLEGLQVWLGLHHLLMMVPFRVLVQHCQTDAALEGPRQLRIIGALHSVYE